MSRVFLTGGSGFIGKALGMALLERGDEVVALARSADSVAELGTRGARVEVGDLCDAALLERAMSGCEVVYHVAGVNKFCVDDVTEMMRTNVDGAAGVVRAARRAEVRRVVYTSSSSAIGEPHGAIGNEFTAHRGYYLSEYERSKTLGERAVLAVASEVGQDVVCVNPSSVQGPGRAGGTGKFLLAFVDGRLKVFVDTHVSLVDIDDTVAGHLLAATRGVAGERYLLSGIRLTIPEALQLAADVAGVKASPHMVPARLATVGGALAEYGFRLAKRKPPVCREMVRELLFGHRYDGSRAQRELGLTYTPVRETLAKTIDWARSAGLLHNV